MAKSCWFAVVLALSCLSVTLLSTEADRPTHLTVNDIYTIRREVEPSKQARVSALDSNCVPLLILKCVGASNFFKRSWADYKVGFGEPSGNYWLGNDLLSRLTASGRYKLKIDLISRSNGNWYRAEYGTFRVEAEVDNYRLQVAGYSGDAGRDALSWHDAATFSTYDRDNDASPTVNCARRYGAGFWYKDCANLALHAARGIYWPDLPGGSALQSARMWLECK